MSAMPSSSAKGGRSVTFLLRQPRQTQGFREVLRGSPAGDAPFERLISEAESVVQFFNEELEVRNQALALTLLWIPPGRFWMGSPETEPERRDSEGPQHLVQLQGFFMSQTPITQAQWREVAGWQERPGERWGRELKTDPSRFQSNEGQGEKKVRLLEGESNTDNRPVEQVSWLDAIEFCHRLSKRTGRAYTLPSEAQWEYACRAGTTTPFHFGDTISPELANYDGNYAYADGPKGIYCQQTTPVGMFPANAWGLHDMHGNVWEWCLDEWHEGYEGAPTDGRAWVDGTEGDKSKETKKTRLLRGGSWNFPPRALPLGLPLPQPARRCQRPRRFPCGLPPPGPFP
jgi:formylglycine-generating enzyme required for sulfatase activity